MILTMIWLIYFRWKVDNRSSLGLKNRKNMAEANAKTANQENASATKKGFVKHVLSGDSIVLQLPTPAGSPPNEVTVYLAYVSAPRMGRRPTDNSPETQDEPYGWEAREFIRKKIVGQTVTFVREFTTTAGREHGMIYVGGTGIENAENITESAVSAGLLEVKGKPNDEPVKKFLELQEKAKAAKLGRWSDDDSAKHVRTVQWVIEEPRLLISKYGGKPVDAVVEQVRDGSTIRAFLLPSFEYVTVAMTGVKTPGVRVGSEGKPEAYGEEAKFFVEIRLLQRDVKIILDGVSNQNILGTVLHPRGNIAEFLLKEGLAKCVDWTMSMMKTGADKLRDAEKYAKEKRLRIWKTFAGQASAPKQNGFSAKVIEIGLADSLTILKDNGEEMKIYFSSLRPPRREGAAAESANRQQTRPLYDIPFMFEAREYLRKRLIEKRVNVIVDYVQPKQDQYPEKSCCTVLFSSQNVAQMLIERGLAKVVRHRQDDDNRSPHYEQLLAAESKAESEKKGMWAERSADQPNTLRVQELQGDAQRSKQFLPYLQRSQRLDALVEYVTSASRLRVFVPKESCLITFLLSGINAPRTARVGPNGKQIGTDEPFAEEAMKFTKYKSLQHEVQIEVETMDKTGGFIGYMFIPVEKGGFKNLSEALVENGLASVHFTAERSPYYSQLLSAEKAAKAAKLNMWKAYVEDQQTEEEKEKQANDTAERKLHYKKVLPTEVYSGCRFAAQCFEDGPSIEKLMNSLQTELKGQPTAPFIPKRQQMCAAKYTDGDLWHRARIEAVKGDKADVYYVDFGNRETLPISRLAPLPGQFLAQPHYAKEYQLALVAAPPDAYAEDSKAFFQQICFSKPYLLINPEYKVANVEAVTLVEEDAASGDRIDVAKQIIAEGFGMVEKRREGRLQTLLDEYAEAEQKARKAHLNIWRYGDFTGNEL